MHLLRGYHATEPANAESILAAKIFLESDKWWEWLGKGVYFFQDTIDYTRYWAMNERKKGTIAKPAIIGADIEYDRFLDLAEPKFFPTMKAFYGDLENAATSGYAKA